MGFLLQFHNKGLQPTALPPLRYGKTAAEPGRAQTVERQTDCWAAGLIWAMGSDPVLPMLKS